MGQGRRFLCLGDTHFPFIGDLKPVFNIIKSTKPHIIIQIGDLYDFYAYSRFPKRVQLTAQQECSKGRIMAEDMWEKIRKLSPKSKCFQLKGNHDDRGKKQVLEKLPEIDHFVDYTSLWEFHKVETIHDTHQELIIDNILFTHGHKNKIGAHLKDYQYMHNVVCGHLHQGGIVYERVGAPTKPRVIWEAGAGYLANPFDQELKYRTSNKFFKWSRGVLEIEDSKYPRFIHFDPLGHEHLEAR